jgi:hypothetical protein
MLDLDNNQEYYTEESIIAEVFGITQELKPKEYKKLLICLQKGLSIDDCIVMTEITPKAWYLKYALTARLNGLHIDEIKALGLDVEPTKSLYLKNVNGSVPYTLERIDTLGYLVIRNTLTHEIESYYASYITTECYEPEPCSVVLLDTIYTYTDGNTVLMSFSAKKGTSMNKALQQIKEIVSKDYTHYEDVMHLELSDVDIYNVLFNKLCEV